MDERTKRGCARKWWIRKGSVEQVLVPKREEMFLWLSHIKWDTMGGPSRNFSGFLAHTTLDLISDPTTRFISKNEASLLSPGESSDAFQLGSMNSHAA